MGSGGFLAEVAEQPAALRRLVAFYRGEGRTLLEQWAEFANEAEEVLFVGMGTSAFVAGSSLGTYEGEGIVARMAEAGELVHGDPIPSDLYVLISQSGRSHETCAVAEQLSEAGEPYVALVNDLDSPLARGAQLALPLQAGVEGSISTKTYANTLALLAMMSGMLEDQDVGAVQDGILEIADDLERTDPGQVDAAAARLSGVRSISFLSTGAGMTAARQAALTFMEGARLPAQALTIGAFRHGPIEIAGPEHGVVIIASEGDSLEIAQRLAARLEGLGSPVVLISDASGGPPTVPAIVIPPGAGWLLPLACCDAQARLLNATAQRRGIQPGDFRHAVKVTDDAP